MGYKKTELDFNIVGNRDVNNAQKIAYFFDTLTDAKDFGLDVFNKVPKRSRGYDFLKRFVEPSEKVKFSKGFGLSKYGTKDFDWIDKPLNTFLYIDRVDNEVNKLSQKISKQDFIDIDQVKKLEFTEKEIGVFSFDLASLGLVRVYEYYSPLLKKIVSPNLIVSQKLPDGQTLFYHVGSSYVPRHEVQYVAKEEGYYSEVLKRRVNKDELIIEEDDNRLAVYFYPEQRKIEKHEVERKQAKDKNGKDKFATTFKKCFINIPRVENTLPRVDIIIPIGYDSEVTPKEAFWNTIQVLSICEKLSKSNVNYRIIGAISSLLKGNGDTRIYKFINLKNENQTLDPNQIALITSDMRFYRMDAFLLKQATQYDSGLESLMISGISYPITNSDEIKKAYINFLSNQSSQTDKEASKLPDSKIVLEYALNENSALIGYNKTICTISGGTWNSRTNTCVKN
jgi:hypothetical protein